MGDVFAGQGNERIPHCQAGRVAFRMVGPDWHRRCYAVGHSHTTRTETNQFGRIRPENQHTMIKSVSALFAIVLLGTISAQAKTLKVPSDEFPVASVSIPDSWEPEEINNGVAGTSEDGAVYLAVVAVGNEKGMNAEIDDTFAMLKEHNVELDQDSKKENKFKVNGFDAEEMLFQGKDEDGPAAVSITFVTIKDKIIVMTYWVSTEDEKKHQEEVGKIVKSLKASS